MQAGEHGALESFVAAAAQTVRSCLDLDLLGALAGNNGADLAKVSSIPPLGQHISVARDEAFAFAYPHLLKGWREQGADIRFFSPLMDEAPQLNADFVYLPGGYPELHAGRLSNSPRFLTGLAAARNRGTTIYGECGGFMVLGDALIDADGIAHRMAGLLPVETSFATRTRHLGYRKLSGTMGTLFAGRYRAHEFHYSTLVRQGTGMALFTACDALDADLGALGLQIGAVAGSYMHLIDLDNDND